MRRVIEFKWNKDAYRLYLNERSTNLRVYPVQIGDEPVLLSPEGRVVPSEVWYGEGGPGNAERRSYALEKTALEEELNRVSAWLTETGDDTEDEDEDEDEDSGDIPEITGIGYKPLDRDRLAVVFIVRREDGATEEDTGFTVEKAEAKWKLVYDGAVWGNNKRWNEVQAMMSHIDFYIGDILLQGPGVLKEIVDRYSWSDRDTEKALFEDEKDTGVVVKPEYGGFVCYFNDFCPEEIFPTVEEAQIEAVLRYTRDEYSSLADDGEDGIGW
jgi:hypothetical protein